MLQQTGGSPQTEANPTSVVGRIEERLRELRRDLASGEQSLRELDGRREQLVTSMLRVSGAVQVLEELIAPAPADAER